MTAHKNALNLTGGAETGEGLMDTETSRRITCGDCKWFDPTAREKPRPTNGDCSYGPLLPMIYDDADTGVSSDRNAGNCVVFAPSFAYTQEQKARIEMENELERDDRTGDLVRVYDKVCLDEDIRIAVWVPGLRAVADHAAKTERERLAASCGEINKKPLKLVGRYSVQDWSKSGISWIYASHTESGDHQAGLESVADYGFAVGIEHGLPIAARLEIAEARVKELETCHSPSIALIATERQRQISVEGYSPDDDADINQNNQLCDAAICYAIVSHFNLDDDTVQCWIADFWPPWDDFKPSKNPIRNLVKAGALIAAEIDRLLRQKATELSKLLPPAAMQKSADESAAIEKWPELMEKEKK